MVAAAFAHRRPNLRTGVRSFSRRRTLLAVLLVAIAVVVGVVAAPGSRADAVPVSERIATWIATTARRAALDLRAVRDLPASERRGAAGRQINELADMVAYLLDADADELRQVWFDAPIDRQIAVFSALSQVGVPYRINADAPFIALDCSALTRFAWAQAGLDIERGSQQQYDRSQRVDRDEVQPGDFVWYPGHIMMSLGLPELIVHARSGERSVEVHRIDSTRLPWMRWASPRD
jgi:cell wall-associated NlpC family hydrolase